MTQSTHKAYRTPLIAGNWKMHMSINEACEFVNQIHFGLRQPGQVDVVVAPPFTALFSVTQILKKSYIGVSAQNLHFEDKGAYTGEISGIFIKDIGVDYVIVGHSERREYFQETKEIVNKKVKAAFRHSLIPILCVGETLTQREYGEAFYVIEHQLTSALLDITFDEVKNIIIAYEPVWAIGTGKTATPNQVEEVHKMIRGVLAKAYDNDTAQKIRILYGGSVNSSNSKELLGLPNVDGALVGGASLKAADFMQIIKSANKK